MNTCGVLGLVESAKNAIIEHVSSPLRSLLTKTNESQHKHKQQTKQIKLNSKKEKEVKIKSSLLMHSIQHYFVVATSTFLLFTATLDVKFGVVHGVSLVSGVVHHGSEIRLRWRNRNSVRNNDSKSNTNIVKKKKTIDELLEVEEEDNNNQPTITITINNVYDDSQYPRQYYQPVGIESSTTITTDMTMSSADKQQQQQQQQHANAVATDMAEMAKDFEQTLVASSSSSSVNMYDLNVGNLLTACDRLENAMRQIGFTQSANDISGNVKKIRKVYNRLPPQERDSLISIVQHEFDTGVHGNDIINHDVNTHTHTLKDSSATMGFLWLGRSINYQNDMFRQMLDHDDEQSSPYNAAKHAYETVLKKHLSWPLQKVSQSAMKRLKPLQMPKTELFCRIGGFRTECYGCQEEQATKRDLRKVVNSWQPLLNQWKQTFSDLDLAQI